MATYKIIQTGDLHVGRGRTTWGEKIALGRSARLFDALFAAARQYGVNGVVITGDIFDRSEPSNRERVLVTQKLLQYASEDQGIDVYVIPGNHDTSSAKASALDVLAAVAGSGEAPRLHVTYGDTPQRWEAAPRLSFLGIPSRLSQDDTSLSATVEAFPTSMGEQTILIGHSMVKGAIQSDNGYKGDSKAPAQERVVDLTQISANHPDIIYYAWGDVHKRQKLPTVSPPARGAYAGSPIPMGFGEEPDRGVLLVTFTDTKGVWEYQSTKFIRIDGPESGFEPLVTVRDPSQISILPANAIISLAAGLIIPTEIRDRVVKTHVVAEDHSSLTVSSTTDAALVSQAASLEVFDPLVSTVDAVEADVLHDFPQNMVGPYREAKSMVTRAIERFRSRIHVG